MTMINLDQDWRLGPQLFEGGFGRLYSTESACGHGAVVKLVPKMPGGDRELLFVNLSGTPNVMPILDYGEWEDFWVLVMPRADKSLREHLTSCGGPLPEVEAVEILKDIIRALAALNGDVVHRDLKPENVLFYQDAWCLADFGIARYAELTTATETWKYAKTKEYAAPEQWRGERATGATDVYATGVMAYELLAGERPFGGPQEHDYRDQHLHEEAPGLTGCRAALASLVAECLYKSPKARPTAENIQGRLEGIGLKVSASGQRLQQADQRAAQQRSGDEALASAAQSVAEERDSLARTAEQSLERMLGALRDRVRDLAPGSHLRGSGQTSWTIELVDTQMGAGGFSSAAASLLDSPGYPAPFDVVAYSSIHVHIPTDHWGYEGRSHSLWFCDAESEGLFRWYETAFMVGPFFGKQGKKDPFALDPDTVVGRALSRQQD